ncbi:GRIN [Lepeophtheirus salmonis]|uniref:GRIN n=1 Tax=Lepeophtheirus salmonis TaxID=72036 RepID=A0A7R8CQN3_LEPSM|nr:GRIN [Lepeophtheirus salmonis]CAF2848436.1 GRIN [Lepeophtheirus salmonis]
MTSLNFIFVFIFFLIRDIYGDPVSIIKEFLSYSSLDSNCDAMGVDIELESNYLLKGLSERLTIRIQLFESDSLNWQNNPYLHQLNEYNGLAPSFFIIIEENRGSIYINGEDIRTLHFPLVVFRKNSEQDYNLLLTCVYTNWNFNQENIDQWNYNFGFKKDSLQISNYCQSSAIGQTIRVEYVAFTPFIMGTDKLEVFSRNAAWGTFDAINNASTGMIKSLSEDKADMGISTPGISYYRHLVVKYTVSVYRQTIDYMCTKPKPLPSYLNIVRPFLDFVWLCILISTIVMALFLYIFYKILRKQGIMNWFTTWSSGRILTITWNIFRTILIMAYCCNLRAVIIAKEYSKPIDTGHDILEQQFTGTYHYLNTKGKLENEVYDEVIQKEGCILFLGILMRDATSGLIKDFSNMPYQFAKYPFGFYHVGYIAQMENSPYMDEFSQTLLRMVDMGIPEKLFKQFLPLEAYIKEKESRVVEGLSINHFITTYTVLAFGSFSILHYLCL